MTEIWKKDIKITETESFQIPSDFPNGIQENYTKIVLMFQKLDKFFEEMKTQKSLIKGKVTFSLIKSKKSNFWFN